MGIRRSVGMKPKGKFNRKQIKKQPEGEEEKPLKRSMLTNSAIVTIRDPSKKCEGLCKNLRKILSPDCLTKLEINPKIQDLADVALQLFVKQIIYISERDVKISVLPNGPTYSFDLISYENSFKNFPGEIYSTSPFLTFEGKSPIKPIFQSFGQVSPDFRRILHFHFKHDLIYIRHFLKTTEDTDDNFKVHMREIGPKITLKYIDKAEGVLPELKVKLKYRNKFSATENNED